MAEEVLAAVLVLVAAAAVAAAVEVEVEEVEEVEVVVVVHQVAPATRRIVQFLKYVWFSSLPGFQYIEYDFNDDGNGNDWAEFEKSRRSWNKPKIGNQYRSAKTRSPSGYGCEYHSVSNE